MSDQWHYRLNGVQHGPVTSAELKNLVRTGTVGPSDHVWKEGLDKWVPASAVKGLISTPPPPPPAPLDTVDPPTRVQSAPPPPPPLSRPNASELASTTLTAFREGTPLVGFHPQKLVIAVAAALGCLATFMPWATVPIVGTIYGTAGDGWITLALFIPALVVALRGDHLVPLAGRSRYIASIPAGLAGLVGINKIITIGTLFSEAAEELGDNPFGLAMAAAAQNNSRAHLALYILVLAGAAVVVSVFILRGDSRSPSIE